MTDTIIYLGTCVVGYLVAVPLRNQKEKLQFVGPAQIVALVCLVFCMGMRIGVNEEVVNSLDTYGLYAFIFTVATMVGSVLAIMVMRKILGINRYGLMKDSTQEELEPKKKVKRGIDKMTLLIVGFVILGIATGFLFCRTHFSDLDKFGQDVSTIIKYELIILLAFVGIDLGLEGKVISNFRRIGFRVFAVPVAIAIGTFAGAFVCTLFLPVTASEGLAIGAGFAWYSLAPGIILDAGHIAAGAISFMHNVMREVLAILFIPIVAQYVGYVETAGLAASTGMDVCLPLIERSTSGTAAVYSFMSGFTLSMAVPILVPLFV